ncbi:MAG: hypothetical protein ACRDJO_02185 [Actinomycetota bacterium]
MNDTTYRQERGAKAEQAKSFLARAKEAAEELVDRVRELGEDLVWVDHLRLSPAGTGVMVVHDAVGTGQSGLVVLPRTTGSAGEAYLLETVLEVPPGFHLRAVRVGFEASSPECCIDLIRLSQLNDPPDAAILLVDDDRARRAAGPAAVEVEAPSIDATAGPVVLTLGFAFEDPRGWVTIRGLGLRLSRSPA